MKETYESMEKINELKPLIHHVTNWVTIYDCANITRAIGALPVMAHAPEEVEEMTGIASALVLNIGTLTPKLIDSMIKAGKKANEKGIPVILDVVGVGATSLRTESAERILKEVRVSVIKGNSAEIGTLAKAKAEVRGVEAISVEGNLEEIAKRVAENFDCVVAITGKEDIVTDGKKVLQVNNGHKLLGEVVGTGCMAASIIGAFCAVEKDCLKATASALSVFGIAGELAAEDAKGPASFKEAFFDELYSLGKEDVERLSRVKEK